MATTRKKLDANQMAARILGKATGELALTPPPTPRQENGRKGGLKGGIAMAEKLTAVQRSEIAKKAAKGRWVTL